MGEKPNKTTRRKVLERIGVGATGIAAVGNVTGKKGAKRRGLAYNPVTHEIYGPASAQINPVHNDFQGVLRIGSKKIQLDDKLTVSNSYSRGNMKKVKYNSQVDQDAIKKMDQSQ